MKVTGTSETIEGETGSLYPCGGRGSQNGRKSQLVREDRCPGAANIRTPTLTIRQCPQYGDEA